MGKPVTRAEAKRTRTKNPIITDSTHCQSDCKRKITSLERKNSELVKKCKSCKEKLTRVEKELKTVKSKLILEQTKMEVDGSPGCFGGGNEESPWLHRRDHPLLNDVILSTVFDHLRKHDLKLCRRVCKKWNAIAIPFMRSKFEVKIYGDKSPHPCAINRRIEDFIHLFSLNTLGIPFAKYRLGDIRNTNEVLTKFIKITGPTAKKIHLNGLSMKKNPDGFLVEDLSEILRFSPQLEYLELPFNLDTLSVKLPPGPKSLKPKSYSVKLFGPGPKSSKPKFPKLRKLNLGEHTYKGRMEKCPTFVEEIFTSAPNICHVKIHDGYFDDTVISSVLEVIEKQGKESSIESLHLFRSRTKHMEVLQKLAQKPNGLKLKRFTLSVDYDSKGRINGIVLAEIFQNTLEYFNLYDMSYHCFKEFPRMPNLKSLTFDLSSQFSPSSVNLNYIFPALETLGLVFRETDVVYDDNFYSQFESSSNEIITSLTLDNLNMTHLGLQRFLTVFPKLKKLKLKLNAQVKVPEVLRMIWTQMTQLEQLDIESEMEATEVDSVLTGIPTHLITLINIQLLELEKETAKGRMETIQWLRNQYREFPSIANLTNLRHLRFVNNMSSSCTRTWRCSNNLTDLTGYLALYPMKHLEHLTIENCELTKSCCEILRTDMELESWCFRGSRVFQIIPSQI